MISHGNTHEDEDDCCDDCVAIGRNETTAKVIAMIQHQADNNEMLTDEERRALRWVAALIEVDATLATIKPNVP